MTSISLSKAGGWLAIVTLASQLMAVAGWLSGSVAVVLAWLTMAAMLPTLNRSARKQSLSLFVLGLAGLVVGIALQVDIDWQAVFAANVPLLTMFVAISFLSLTNAPDADAPLPRGNRAAVITTIGTNLLGAVINLSVVLVFGDRLRRQGTLSNAQQIALTRCFTAAAWWSPFFIATGVALMYAPGMTWTATIIPGVVMTILAIGYTLLDIRRRDPAQFEGYPLQAESLVIPILMAASVLLLHHYFPDVSIIVLISILSVLGSLLFMRERPRGPVIRHFIEHRLLSAGAQFALFLAAGVFSAGIKTLLAIHPGLIDLHRYPFDAGMFALFSAAMIGAGLVGVHPLISIAVVSPILLPLSPDPASLGFMFLSTWAISTGSGPLSGIGLVMTGRYGISSRQIIKNNWHYVVVMWGLACVVNAVLL
ncbi:hypothetical protein [Alteromonas gilva]|uniref:Citrate transporter n=1 Tax=Alteromonas gilva TaxID=2987522 RepID=A0ABT5L5U4_9ALTE|nr:hypothetical protein [Alteromonas gilva]MDC8832429.1 hypothetical protein [Alteromonas gilva]